MRRLTAVFGVAIFASAPVTALAAGAHATAPAQTAPAPAAGTGITASAALLVDLSDGGDILFSRAAHAVRAPASLTKIVTALVVRDEYSLDEIVTVDSHVNTAGGSSLGLRPGMRFTVRDLLYALLLKSANDAAAALAAHHPLGYGHFIHLMNEKARSLGAYNSNFQNPHGLDAADHVSSAWDLAIFARQLLADTVLAQIVSTERYSMPWPDGTRRSFSNHNKLLQRYPGTVGVKTGFTVRAGHCLIAAAETPAGSLLSVILDSKDHYADTVALFAYGRRLELENGSGGGGPEGDVTHALPSPPRAPDVAGLSAIPLLRSDVRDDPHLPLIAAILATITALAIVLRRGEESGPSAWLAALSRTAPRR